MRKTAAVLCALMLAIPVASFGSVNDDQVTSQKIKEADNNGSQNTNSGSGVKTNHIQNLAVTGPKLADDAVTSVKIQNGTVGSDDLADGAVTNAKLATPGYSKAEVDAMVGGLQDQIAALQYLLQHFSRNGNEVTIAGANLHIVSGAGATDGPVNGLGNLVVGYNESRTGIPGVPPDNRTGSHNIIAGSWNNYSSYGGLVVGGMNEIAGTYSAVSGGTLNIASGVSSAVSGGVGNTASGAQSSVSGGFHNDAVGQNSSVSGGGENTASGGDSSVCGGSNNTASGTQSSVSGGLSNIANNYVSSVSGGAGNTAGGEASSVSGGNGNGAMYWYSSVSGGLGRVVGGTYDWQAGALFEDQ